MLEHLYTDIIYTSMSNCKGFSTGKLTSLPPLINNIITLLKSHK